MADEVKKGHDEVSSNQAGTSSIFQELFNMDVRLNAAESLEEITRTVSTLAFKSGATEAQLFIYLLNEEGIPSYAEMAVNINQANQPAVVPVGTRLNMAEYPLMTHFSTGNSEPLLVSDVSNDPRIDEEVRGILKSNDILSTAILPLVYQNIPLALALINWEKKYTFTDSDLDLYRMLTRQATIAINNRLLISHNARRANEMNIVAEVSTKVATLVDRDEILQTVVDLTKKEFGLYHAHIYLLDTDSDHLVLSAGAGEVGKKMIAQGWRIPLDREQSLVARAARSRAGVVVNDVRTETGFMANELLPNTRAEMAIPLLAGDRLFGVLDVQSSIVAWFTREDVGILTALAAHVAIALQNSERFFQVRQSEQLVRTIIDSTPDWIFVKDRDHRYRLVNKGYADALHISADAFVGKDDLELGFPEELVKGNPEKGISGFWADDNLVFTTEKAQDYPNDMATIDDIIHHFDTLKVPVADASGSTWGVLAFSRDVTARVKAEETLAKRAADLTTVAELSTAITTIHSLEEMLQTVVDLTKQRFSLYHAHIYLLDADGDTLTLRSGAGDVGKQMVAQGWQIPLDREKSLVARAARTREGVIINDVQAEIGFMSNPLLPDTHAEMAVPMVVGETVVGVLDVQSDVVGRFTEDDIAIQTALAGQVAVAIQNAIQYEQIQTREMETEELYQAGVAISTATNYAQILDVIRNFTAAGKGSNIVSFNMFDQPWADEKRPEWIDVVAYHSDIDTASIALHYPVSSFPLITTALHPDHPTLVADVMSEPLFSEGTRKLYSEAFKAKSTMFIPLSAGGQWIGYINANFPKTTHFTEQEIRRLMALTGVVAVAVQNLRSIEKAEAALTSLSQNQAQLSEAMSIARLANWEYDIDRDRFIFNDQFYSIFHTTAEKEGGYELSSQQYAERLVHPEDVPLVGQAIERALASTDRHYSVHLEHRILYNDGGVGYLSVNVHIERDDQGRIIRYYGANQDITDIKLAEIAEAKRASELATVSEVSTTVTTILSLQTMLQAVVDLTKQRFNLYHAHIYLLDDHGDTLTLRSGAGEVGKQMVAQGWQIPLDREKSLVARAARTRKGVITNDIQAEIGFMPNPLLPDTRAEMAVPMVVGDTLIGVLDVQSDVTGRFTEDDVSIQTTLAGQVAVAVQNAIQYAQIQAREMETEELYQAGVAISTATSYAQIMDVIRKFTVAGKGSNNVSFNVFDRPWTDQQMPEWIDVPARYTELETRVLQSRYPTSNFSTITKALHPNRPTIIVDLLTDPLLDDSARALYVTGFKAKSTIFVPLSVGGQWIGYMNAIYPQTTEFSEQDIRRLMALTGLVAVAVQNLRSIEQAEAALASLRQNQAQLSEALLTAKMGYWEYDFVKDVFTLTDQFYAIYHTTAEEQGGYTMSSGVYASRFTLAEDGPIVGAAIQEGVETTDPNFSAQIDHRYVRGDGTIGYISVRFKIVKDENGRTIKSYGANQDITEVKLAEMGLAKRAAELATVSEVSSTVTTILAQQTMLQTVVDLTKQRFNLYHAHIYMLDDNGETLSLTAGAGDVGKQMVAQGWQIPLSREKSLVARAARTRQGVIINDVQSEIGFMPNPLLPETRSEMAVPMIVGDTLLGVLDVQSDTAGRFSDEDISIQTTLAAQVAVAVQNAIQFSQVQARELETENLYQAGVDISTATNYDQIMSVIREHTAAGRGANNIAFNLFDQPWTDQQMPIWIEVVAQYSELETGTILARYPISNFSMITHALHPDRPTIIADVLTEPVFSENARKLFHDTLKAKSVIFIPLVAGGQWIGYIDSSYPQTTEFSEQDIHRLMALTGLVAVAVQNLRSIEQAEAALASLRQNQAQLSEALLTAKMGYWEYDFVKDVFTLTDQFYAIYHTTAEEQGGYTMNSGEYSSRFTLAEDGPIVGAAIQEAVDTKDPNFSTQMDHRYVRADGSIGYITVRFKIVKDAQGRTIKSYGANQDITEVKLAEIGLAKRATELATVSEVSTAISTILSPQTILQTVVDLTKQRFNLYHAHIYLLNSDGDILTLSAGAGEAGKQMVGQGWQIPLNREQSLVARAARKREGVIINDVLSEPGFMPNPLLPETRSEMAIPMIVGNRLLGVLDVQASQPDYFTDEDINIENTLATQVAIALQNARSFDQIQRQAEQEALINTISQKIQTTTDVESALQVAVRELGRALGARKTTVQLSLDQQPSTKN